MHILDNLLFGVSILEWIGYVASAFVLISLSMSSLIKLRWLNLIGAVLFSCYGFLIGSLPVGIMNFLIVCANIYNLHKIYASKDKFVAIPVKDNPDLMNHFLTYYAKDISKFFPHFKPMPLNFSLILNPCPNKKAFLYCVIWLWPVFLSEE